MSSKEKTEKLSEKFTALSEESKQYTLAIINALAYAETMTSSDNKKGAQNNEKN